MRKWVMPYIVEEGPGQHREKILLLDHVTEARLIEETHEDSACIAIGSKRMLKPRVCGTGIDEMRWTQLADPTQSLKVR